MTGICEGRVAIVTGAGRGLGRGYALELARQGAKVVVNDLGAGLDGGGGDSGPAQAVVDEIVAMGGEAVVNGADVADWDSARGMVEQATDTFGRLDILINNAGILRDRMLFNMGEQEWDDVVRVHLKGTVAPLRFAAEYWRNQAKSGVQMSPTVVSTTSWSGLFANVGQANYGAAKTAIATLSVIAAKELDRYGVRVNAISPGALTRMTEGLPYGLPDEDWDFQAPENVAPLVTYLSSDLSAPITGRIFLADGGRITVVNHWSRGPMVDKGSRWDAAELADVVPELVAQADDQPTAADH